jgi:hypothetical protein
MKIRVSLIAVTVLLNFTAMNDASAKAQTFVNKPSYTTKAGKKVIIYGSRSGDCKTAPAFAAVEVQASGDPAGKLSDAGVGFRPGDAQFCPEGRPVRLIAYTPGKGFKGAASFVFWGSDTVSVTVK